MANSDTDAAPAATSAPTGMRVGSMLAPSSRAEAPRLAPSPKAVAPLLPPVGQRTPPGVSRLAQRSAVLGWMESSDVYGRLRQAVRRPILLDGAGEHPEARFGFIAFDPVEEVRADAADPEWFAKFRRRVAQTTGTFAEHQPFTGGWAGFLGYEAAVAFEPTLPRRAPSERDEGSAGKPSMEGAQGDPDRHSHPGAQGKSDPQARRDAQVVSGAHTPIPDAIFRLYTGAVVIDRHLRTITLYCADLAGDERKAQAKLESILSSLARAPQFVSATLLPPAVLEWKASLGQADFERAVETLQAHIRGGDLFQANLATRFQAACAADPLDLFMRLRRANPSPFMGILEYDDFALVSGSPEQLFALQDGVLRSRPIAGTRRRGTDPTDDLAMEEEIRTDAKEQAEHTMLLDLVRNDVAKVSKPGSVRVPERMSVERYRHVMHLVSCVEGRLRPGLSALDALAALFPGGTVTGAPKHRACIRIHEAEPVRRGPYTGSAGFISWSGNARFNILIRTVVLQDGKATVHAGSGIVADSQPAREWKEAGRKARALLEAAQGIGPLGTVGRLGEVTKRGTWEPPHARMRVRARVVLIDNYDSFVHNLADYCAALGAEVTVERNDSDWRAKLASFAPTHIILSPGPGRPEGAGSTMDIVRELSGRLPILGVCLGHQSIVQAFGGLVEVGDAVHGKVGQVIHGGRGLFAGLPSPLSAARYHSLHTPEAGLPSDFEVTARLSDGTVMAFRHRRHPTFGVQFHPESICTDRGLELLSRFLEQHA